MSTLRFPLLLSWLAVGLLATACGDDDGPPPSGGDAGSADSGPSPDANAEPIIALPEPPRLTPCPSGHREVLGPLGVPHCDPWPVGGAELCPEGEAHFPGEPGCTRVGPACPTSGFPEGLPADAVFVDGGGVSGDGSRDAPFATIAEALDAAADGGVVAIAPGRYEATLFVDRPVTLHGACTDVVLVGEAAAIPRPALRIRFTTAVIRDLRIADSHSAVLSTSSNVTLRNVVVEGMRATGLFFTEGSVDAESLVIRDVDDVGFHVLGGTGALRRVLIEDVGSLALDVSDGDVTAEDVIVRRVGGAEIEPGLFIARDASTLSGARMVFEDNVASSLLAIEGSALSLRDLLSEPAAGLFELVGILALEGSEVQVERAVLRRPAINAIGVAGVGSGLTASDLLITDVRGSAEGRGHAIEAAVGGIALVERARVEGARSSAVFFHGAGTEATLRDVEITNTLGDASGRMGRGLQVQNGGQVTGERLALRGNREVSVVAAGPGTLLTISDTYVGDTAPRDCASAGCEGAGAGLGAYLSGSLRALRFRVERSALAGVQIARDGEMDLAAGLIADNPVGANVQVPGFDVARLTTTVSYRGNGVNLDATSLPTPDPTAPAAVP